MGLAGEALNAVHAEGQGLFRDLVGRTSRRLKSAFVPSLFPFCFVTQATSVGLVFYRE